MITINNVDYYTMVEMAEQVKLTTLTLRKYRIDGKIKTIKHGNKYLISKNDIDAFLEGLKFDSTKVL